LTLTQQSKDLQSEWNLHLNVDGRSAKVMFGVAHSKMRKKTFITTKDSNRA